MSLIITRIVNAIIRRVVPSKVLAQCLLRREARLVKKFNARYPQIVASLRGKERYRVAFFLIHASVWKYDELFKLMLHDDRFDPVVVVCPYLLMGQEVMIRDMETARLFVENKGYPYLTTLDQNTGQWFDVKKNLSPDMVFFTNPYRGLTRDEYFIDHFEDSLNFYVPYSSMICNVPYEYNKHLQNMVYRMFIENDLSAQIARAEMPTKGENTEVVGFPPLDIYLAPDYRPQNVWKHQMGTKIIWAPHHTIYHAEHDLNFSNFLVVADSMVELARKYSSWVQFSFKPHPLLRGKLEQLWGEAKTEEYYRFWSTSTNTQYDNGDYVDLFATSDAMIFDSISFINEYLYTRKPSLFVYNDSIDDQLNTYGHKALECHSKGYTVEQIEQFIVERIEKKADPLAPQRNEYYQKYLLPKNGEMASQHILNFIKETVGV